MHVVPWLLVALLAPSKEVGRLPPGDAVPVLEKAPDGRAVLTLRQGLCVFREAEPGALPYTARTPAECERVNRVSAAARSKDFVRLRVKAGKYQLEVMNAAAPWPTGFELQGEHDPSLPKVKGEGIAPSTGKRFQVDLVPGEYVYRCPVMKTPDYRLLVEE
jgi:hypothetical protein